MPQSSVGGAGETSRIAAAICTYQRYDLLPDAIESILRQSLSRSQYCIVVIDNSPDAGISTDCSRRWTNERNFRWIQTSVAGLSHARNLAAAAAGEVPLVAFLDDDAVADEGWLEALLEAFEHLGPEAYVVGGRVRPRFGAPPPPWLDGSLLTYLSVCDLGATTRFLQPDEWVVGANIGYRTKRLLEVGGFNVALGRVGSGASLMSNDETELAERLRALGGRTGYAPNAEVIHFVPAERLTQEWFRRRIAWQAVSDFVRAPVAMQTGAGAAWVRLKDYLAACRPADRTVRGLVIPQENSEQFKHQMSAVYETIVALLAGQAEADAD
jgi:glucosyl-dolichyl phosphate glucuronosyltransferase